MNPYVSAGIAAAVAALVGFGAGYQVNSMTTSTKITALEAKVTELETKATETAQLEVPTDDEASAALAKSGRSMQISECIQHPTAPGVTCTGTITTTTGSFAGSKEPGRLSFAKIDGVWAKIN